MEILKKINLRKIKGKPDVYTLFIIWFIFSTITIFVFYFQINALRNVDIPTHIGAGMVIAAFIFSTIKTEKNRKAFGLAFIPFILWEFIELGISSQTQSHFLFRLFYETEWNKMQDVGMDVLGFLVFMKLTGKKF